MSAKGQFISGDQAPGHAQNGGSAPPAATVAAPWD
jgi:hypothetical protein